MKQKLGFGKVGWLLAAGLLVVLAACSNKPEVVKPGTGAVKELLPGGIKTLSDVNCAAPCSSLGGSVSTPVTVVTDGTPSTLQVTFTVTGRQGGDATFKVNQFYTYNGSSWVGSNPITFNSGPRVAGPNPTPPFTYTATISLIANNGSGTSSVGVAPFGITNTSTPALALGPSATATIHVKFEAPTPTNTAPNITVPANITSEATGPTGAVVSYIVTASDNEDGNLNGSVTCTPASGSTFPLGETTVNCSVTDEGELTTSASFKITVVDTTAPALTLPSNITTEATGPSGATVSFAATASDLVSGNRPVTCTPASGGVFGLGTTTVNCSATDAAGNEATGSFTVAVQDTTPPSLSLPANITTEATGPGGAVVTFAATANDIVDGSVTPSCAPSSGSTFPIATTTVNCSATDAAGNTASGSFAVKVQDTTPPVISGTPDNQILEATGPAGATATYTNPTANDLVDGSVAVSCSPASGSTFPIATTTVTCTATDTRGNSSSTTFTVKVQDTTPPTITWVGSISNGASYYFGSVPAAPTCTATDIVSGSVPCTVSGYSTAVGSHTLTASATDGAGNTATSQRNYTVLAWTLNGFYQPVDMGGVFNTVKGGSTVPFKFEVFAGSTELTSTSAVKSFTSTPTACPSGPAVTEDEIEVTTTGGTSLRYDTIAGQFIQNWQTPKQPGACYKVTMTTLDGSSLVAFFKLK